MNSGTAPRLVMLNNKDSFVFNLVRYFEVLGADVMVYDSDRVSLSEIESERPGGIVISPGPSRPENAGVSIAVAKEFSSQIPVLGVCLGHQAIASAFGWSVVRAIEPVHGRVRRIRHNGVGLFRGLKPVIDVGLYNSLTVDRLSSKTEDLRVDALSDNGDIMALSHKQRLVWGVQFHPESILTPSGMTILDNFMRIVRKRGRYGVL